MPSAHINPQSLKNCLLDAVDIGKEGGQLAPFPLVGVTIDNGAAQAYGRSSYAVGWSFTDRPLDADELNTVLIEFDEAKELAQAVGKTSAAKDATVWAEIEQGRLIINYGEESVADLPGVEPAPGDIDGINQDLTILDEAGSSERGFFAMGIETIKRFTKVRGKCPYMDIWFTDIGNTSFVKIGDHFIGGFEAIARDQIEDPKLFSED